MAPLKRDQAVSMLSCLGGDQRSQSLSACLLSAQISWTTRSSPPSIGEYVVRRLVSLASRARSTLVSECEFRWRHHSSVHVQQSTLHVQSGTAYIHQASPASDSWSCFSCTWHHCLPILTRHPLLSIAAAAPSSALHVNLTATDWCLLSKKRSYSCSDNSFRELSILLFCRKLLY